MTTQKSENSKATARAQKEARLKAALKANMARRKAQVRGRKAPAASESKAE